MALALANQRVPRPVTCVCPLANCRLVWAGGRGEGCFCTPCLVSLFVVGVSVSELTCESGWGLLVQPLSASLPGRLRRGAGVVCGPHPALELLPQERGI